MDDTERTQAGGSAPARPPRTVNIAALAGAVLLIGLVSFAVYRRSHPAGAPAGGPEAGGATAPVAAGSEEGTEISAPVPIHLSPEASIVAERYRCICGCNDPLNVCTCTRTPGSRDMKLYVQQLVNDKKPPAEIDALMVDRYGEAVLLSAPVTPPAPSESPALPKRSRSARAAGP